MAVAVVAHSNGLANGFAYDDVHLVVENQGIQRLSTLPGALAQPYWPGESGVMQGLWRPLTTAVLGAEYALWGLRPAPYHAVNILLHGVVSGLVVLVLAELLPILAAVIGGLLFAVHPVHVEAVANVVGLAELVSAGFYLAACLVAMRRKDGAGVPLVMALYALAFLAKESAATLPAAIVLLDGARRSLRLGDLGRYVKKRGPLLAGLVVTGLAVLAARTAVLGSTLSPEAPLGAELLAEVPRIQTLGVVWVHYVRLMIFPLSLSADYSPGVIPVLTVWTPVARLGVGLVLGLLGLGLLSWPAPALSPGRLSAKTLGFAVVWFVVTISPVSNVLFLSGVLLAERTLYLPSVAVAATGGAALAWLVGREPRPAWALTGLVLALLAVRGWVRTPVWKDSGTVFTALIAEQPSSGRAQWALGDVLRGRGRSEEAYRAYARAVGLLDGTYRLLTDVGWQAHEDGRNQLAENMLLRAWQDRPDLARAPRNLMLLYQDEGRPEEVLRFARETLGVMPGDVASWHLRAGASAELGRWEEAIAAREKVIALGEGEHWQQWISLATLRLTAGDSAGAQAARDTALLKAGDEEARNRIRESFQPLPTPVGTRDPL